MKNVIKPGEVWSFTTRESRQTREGVVLNVFENGLYVVYCLLHPTKKGSCTCSIASMSGMLYCDPRKLSFAHSDMFDGFVRGVSNDKLQELRTKAAEGIGFIGDDSTSITQQLACSQASVESMSEKIKELTHYKEIYEKFIKMACDKMVEGLYGESTEVQQPRELKLPEESEVKEVKKVETEEEKRARRNAALYKRREENKKKYLPKQKYIEKKIENYGLKQVSVARLIGVESSTISFWINGKGPANWKKLERIFPGIEAEADEYVRQLEKRNS